MSYLKQRILTLDYRRLALCCWKRCPVSNFVRQLVQLLCDRLHEIINLTYEYGVVQADFYPVMVGAIFCLLVSLVSLVVHLDKCDIHRSCCRSFASLYLPCLFYQQDSLSYLPSYIGNLKLVSRNPWLTSRYFTIFCTYQI